MASKLWVDVEDLFLYAAYQSRPSGIQRLQYELCRALSLSPDAEEIVRFVRHDTLNGSFSTVTWNNVEQLFSSLADRPVTESKASHGLASRKSTARTRQQTKEFVYLLPLEIRVPLLQAISQGGNALRSAFAALGASVRACSTKIRRLMVPTKRGAAATFANDHLVEDFHLHASAGDTLVALGSPWSHPAYGKLIETLRREKGMLYAVLVYDIIPLRRPEWCDEGLVRLFSEWFGIVLPLSDVILTISRATADDVLHYAAKQHIALRSQPRSIPIGTGFHDNSGNILVAKPCRPPPTEPYVLIVSTIEVRKNHVLLLHVWRRLLEEMPIESVPTLVIAGRIGWLVADFLQQLQNTCFLDGKIALFLNPTDSELRNLYQNCQFTVFPSFYEGWGLPVSESLAFRRPCVISNATSLPEAGGAFARYFDPYDVNDAYRVIREVVEHPGDLLAWSDRIAQGFRPLAWSDSARAVISAVNGGVADSGL